MIWNNGIRTLSSAALRHPAYNKIRIIEREFPLTLYKVEATERKNSILEAIEIKMSKKVLMVSILLAGLIPAGCGKSGNNSAAKGDSTAVAAKKGERKVLFWYDPMSPTIHFDHPGKSPTMGMGLVPKYADEDEGNPNIIKVDPAMVQNIGVLTAPVERRKLTRTINTYGVVMPDEKSISDINTRVGGWIEKLYFDYTGMDVEKGQQMAVIYSQDLIAAEQEFLQSVSFASASGNPATQSNTLIKSARERLAFFGMNEKQIDELQSTGNVVDRVVIHSPSDGVIFEKDVFDGQRISAGQTLFRVVDLRRVWILADVFKIDMPFLKLGSPTTVAYNNSQSYKGRVDFIYPEVDATARTAKARISLNNPALTMKVGQYVNVAIHSEVSYDALAVPAQAVINTGLRQVVAVVLGGGRFEIRDIELGAYADGYYEVTDGLSEGDTIVTSGQFLIDSDANLKSAGDAMTGMPGMSSSSSSSQTTQPKADAPQVRKKTNENNDMENMPGMNMSGKKDTVKSPKHPAEMSDSTEQVN